MNRKDIDKFESLYRQILCESHGNPQDLLQSLAAARKEVRKLYDIEDAPEDEIMSLEVAINEIIKGRHNLGKDDLANKLRRVMNAANNLHSFDLPEDSVLPVEFALQDALEKLSPLNAWQQRNLGNPEEDAEGKRLRGEADWAVNSKYKDEAQEFLAAQTVGQPLKNQDGSEDEGTVYLGDGVYLDKNDPNQRGMAIAFHGMLRIGGDKSMAWPKYKSYSTAVPVTPEILKAAAAAV